MFIAILGPLWPKTRAVPPFPSTQPTRQALAYFR